VIHCPQELVGKIIGRGGENVQRILSQTSARVTVNQHAADGSRRYVCAHPVACSCAS
jgi:predicted RNA-binding protein YlqC (UPF0109 family)